MEVISHRVNKEVVVPQLSAWRPDGGSSVGFSEPVNALKNDGLSEKTSVKNEGNSLEWPLLEQNLKVEDINIPKLINSIIDTHNTVNLVDKIASGLSFTSSTSEEKEDTSSTKKFEETVRIDLVQESDEEVIELEFVRAVDKLHTHTPYCPNCSSQITKVILRRKKSEDTTRSAASDGHRRDKALDLFGCLSCFSIFIPSGNILNPFRLFGAKRKSAEVVGNEHTPGVNHAAAPEASKNTDGRNTIKQGKKAGESHSEYEDYSRGNVIEALPVISGHRVPLPDGYPQFGPSVEDGSGHVSEIVPTDESLPSDHLAINVADGTENAIERGSDRALGSEPVEIVKCIVYGGLTELITSLSVVSSAAASGASTLNIFGLGLATLISGIFVFGQNLVDLKNDASKQSSDQQEVDRYEELLGKRGHFLLHGMLAVLSFLIFGVVPPVVYAFAFYESDDKDYKLLAVAAASFACIAILAAAQAYVKGKRKAGHYFKVVMYYAAVAVAASGVAYGAGDLIKMLLERLGWFGAGTPAAGGSGTPAWASY